MAINEQLFGDDFLNQYYKGSEVHVSPYRYYVVFKGIEPGIYDSWPEAEKQVKGFSGSKYKAYMALGEAREALENWLTVY